MEKIDHIRKWLGSGSINIFGLQFSGKDTVGKQLANLLGAQFISSGDVMRDIFLHKDATTDPKIWQAAQSSSLTGFLMPTDEFQLMIASTLSNPALDGKPLILSTVGRWIGEEQPVLELLRSSDHETKAVLLLTISEAEAWRRWQEVRDARDGGRHDDVDEEKVARRFAEYYDKTIPVIDVYRGMNILLEVNAEQKRETVLSDVIDVLYEFSRRRD